MQEDSGSAPTFFREHKEFFVSLDKAAQSASNAGSWDSDNAPEEEARLIREMCSTLELYQEQPTCLDPYIERIVSQLMRVIQNHTDAFHDSVMDAEESRAAGSEAHARAISTRRLSGVFDMVYTLCKVRGYKVVLRFFPHQVANVEPVFVMLWHHAATFDTNGWTARYVLLIWLSLLAMIPFDIESMDSGLASLPDLKPADAAVVGPGGSLIERWVGLGRLYLRRPGCEMEGAAVMLSRLLSRKDTVSSLQPAFLEWAIGEVSEVVSSESHEATSSKKGISIGGVLRINGALRVLCHLLLAMDSRGALDKHIAPLMDIFHSDAFEQNSLTRKLIAKAAQRLALLSLPPPAAAAASGGARGSAVANLRGDVSDAGKGGAEHGMDDDGIVDGALGAEVPEDVEGFVGILLHKLHDRDTIVRWSAAKGVGRISERLPAALAHEIASAVADILKDEALVLADGTIDVSMTSEFSWHGALLCLAELARRGLLAQQALREVVPWIIRGLTYEIQRGDYSVGSNVRDAACYTMWSFARVHRQSSRQVFNEMRMQMATALVSVAVFDREANVRRAASAAFQEHVGRHDSFPHGIPVLQLADFFSVGNMRNAFVAASRRIVEFAEYREPLLRHLCTTTIYHWDLKTRELAAEALRELAPVAAEYVITALLPDIVRNTQSPFLAVRHGAIVATGVIAETLASHLRGNGEVSKNVLSVATAIPQRYLDDFGASLTLSALARYMGSLSRARWDLGGDAAQSTYFDLFVQAFTSCTNQNALVPEFTAFADGFGITAEQREMIERYTSVERSGGSREGFVLALGALLDRKSFELLCSLVTGGASVEIRRNAASALGQFCERGLGSKKQQPTEDGGMTRSDIPAATEALLEGLLDHTVDNRGDVGSWVRKQCLCSLATLFCTDKQTLSRLHGCHDLVDRLFGRVLHAATEKIDKLRAAAGELLECLLYDQQSCSGQGIDSKDAETSSHHACQLKRFIPERGSQGAICWADSEAVYGQLVYALDVSEEKLRQPLFEGFVATGSAEPLGRFAVSAVAKYAETLAGAHEAPAGGAVEEQQAWSVDGMVRELTRLLLTDRRTSKIINPTLTVADQLVEQGALMAASSDVWIPLYRAVQRLAYRLRAPHRLALCLKLYASLSLVSGELLRLAASSLLSHLAHPIPKIRQTAADHLFTVLCINGGTDLGDKNEEQDKAMESMADIEQLLTETEWMRDDGRVKEARARLAALVRQTIA